MWRVQLIGEARLLNEVSDPIWFPWSACEEFIGYLATQPKMRCRRTQVASVLWADKSKTAAAANLRKAIQRVKSCAPDLLLMESKGGWIGLNSQKVTVDYLELVNRVENADSGFVNAVVMEELTALWKAIDQPVLESTLSQWAVSFQESHESLRSSFAQEYWAAAKKLRESDWMVNTAKDLYQFFANQPIQLTSIFQTVLEKASSNLAIELLNYWKTQGLDVQATGAKFRSLVQLAKKKLESDRPAQVFSSPERELIADIFQEELFSEETASLNRLAIRLADSRYWSDPATALKLCQTVIKQRGFDDHIIRSLALTACFLAANTGDFAIGIELANRLLKELQEQDEMRMRTLSILGFLNFEAGNYEDSFTLHNQALDLCHKLQVKTQYPRVLNRLAVLEFHTTNFDQARMHFDQALDAIASLNSEQGAAFENSILSNKTHAAYLEFKWDEVIQLHDQLKQHRAPGDDIFLAFVDGCVGVAMLNRDQTAEGIKSIIESILSSARRGQRRFNHYAIESAIVALTRFGRPIEPWLEQNCWLRSKNAIPYSPAEIQFFEKVGISISVEPQQSKKSMTQLALCRALCRELQNIAKSLSS